MFKGIVIFLFALVGCHADTSAAPTSGVYCGQMPEFISPCLGNPKLIGEFPDKCKLKLSECDKMTCIFTEFGWLIDNKVNKTKVSEYFDQFASDHPAWSLAVKHLQTTCLGDRDLPAQGVYMNCAPYDIMHCGIISFIRNARPSQWKTMAKCEYPRAYAGACPICPTLCFNQKLPYGACNACITLPKSVLSNNYFILYRPKLQ